MSTWDKNGLKVKNIISETIKSDSGDSFLTKEVADGLYASIGSGGDNGSNDGESYLVESVWNDNFNEVENSGTSTVLPLWSYKRIYSDGYIEQGGSLEVTSTLTTVNYHKQYNEIPTVILSRVSTRGGSSYDNESYPYSASTSSFAYKVNVTEVSNLKWKASGYGEILSISSPLRTSQLYFKLAHEFYAPAQAEIQEKLDLIDSLVVKTDINLPTLSSRWDSDFSENLGWVKSEGQWLNGNTYHDAYDLMVSRIGVNAKFIEATEGTEFTDENADKFLIDTTAVKFRLPLINGNRTLVAHVYQEDTYGHSSYNLYSDGYCTQEYAFYPNATSGTLTLLKGYKDTKYNATMADMGVDNDADNSGYDLVSAIASFQHKTNSSIRFSIGDKSRAVNVYTYGMCNIPSILEYNCNNYLFFKLADEVPSTVINTEQIIADLKQECDDFKNECSVTLAQADYVIETYNDGDNWYRLYKSGWIEQGGTYPSSNVSSSIVLTLPTPFTTTNYIVMITGDGNVNAYAPLYNTKTTTSFSIFGHGGGGGAGNWYACGI